MKAANSLVNFLSFCSLFFTRFCAFGKQLDHARLMLPYTIITIALHLSAQPAAFPAKFATSPDRLQSYLA